MRMRALGLVALAIATGGCTSLAVFPRDGDVISGSQSPVPVTVRLEWPSDARAMMPAIDIDGEYVPDSQLTYSRTGVTATVYLRPGVHTLQAYAVQACWICVGNIGQFNVTRTFLVTTNAPTVGISVAPLLAKNSE